jgi:hypothetical protein
MNTPDLFSVDSLVEAATHCLQEQEDRWVPARPPGLQGLFLRRRLRTAWAVFSMRMVVSP